MCLNFWLMLRNQRVGRFRLELIDRITKAAETDIQGWPLLTWKWRYDILHQVSYERMLYQFWKPLRPEVWWKDTSFLNASRDDPAWR